MKSEENSCLKETKCIMTAEIAEMHYKVNDIHKLLMGNGKEGMYQEFQQAKGSIKMMKWLIGGGLAGIIWITSTILGFK